MTASLVTDFYGKTVLPLLGPPPAVLRPLGLAPLVLLHPPDVPLRQPHHVAREHDRLVGLLVVDLVLVLDVLLEVREDVGHRVVHPGNVPRLWFPLGEPLLPLQSALLNVAKLIIGEWI